jgi:hypothetical protein
VIAVKKKGTAAIQDHQFFSKKRRTFPRAQKHIIALSLPVKLPWRLEQLEELGCRLSFLFILEIYADHLSSAICHLSFVLEPWAMGISTGLRDVK